MFCTHHLHGGSPEIIPKEVHYRSPGSQVFVFYNGWHVVKHKTASQSLIVADRHRHHKNRGVHSVALHSQAYHSFTQPHRILNGIYRYIIKRPHIIGLISTKKKKKYKNVSFWLYKKTTLTITEILIGIVWYFHLHAMPCNNNKLQFCIH